MVDGFDVDMVVEVGDKVIIGKYAGTEVKIGDDKCIIVRQNDILARVED
jgi:chaperonin GroES